MKKQIIKAMVFLMGMTFATSAFAVITISGNTQLGGGTFAPSAKVQISAVSDGIKYVAISKHATGKKQFGTTSVDPKIYYDEGNTTADPTAAALTQDFSGGSWKSY